MQMGYIKVYRSIFNNQIWLSEPFTRAQAWVDLLLLANHSPNRIYIRGNAVDIGRGQMGWSVKNLSRRWRWSQGKTNRFLNQLKIDGQIGVQKSNLTTLITITNYDNYQKTESRTEHRRRADGEQTETNNNVNNVKNVKGVVDCEKYPFLKNAFFKENWDGFLETRRAMRKPATERAQVRILADLHKHPIETATKMLEKSLRSGWTDVYELKTEQKLSEAANDTREYVDLRDDSTR